jgi:hypothetical protein
LAQRTADSAAGSSQTLMKPLPVDGPVDSAALNYVLHCLRGSQSHKSGAIRNVAAVLEPDGVLFGGTVLRAAERHTAQARAILPAFTDLAERRAPDCAPRRSVPQVLTVSPWCDVGTGARRAARRRHAGAPSYRGQRGGCGLELDPDVGVGRQERRQPPGLLAGVGALLARQTAERLDAERPRRGSHRRAATSRRLSRRRARTPSRPG